MVNFEETYEGLEDLIVVVVRDQYFLACPKDLQTFLKEQGNLDLKQMTEKSTNYIEAYGTTIHLTKEIKFVRRPKIGRGRMLR